MGEIMPRATDLSTLDLSGLVSTIRAEHAAAQESLTEALQHAIRVGEALLAAKKLVPVGGWGTWIREEVELQSEQVSQYIRIAYYWDQLPPGITSKAKALDAVKGLPVVESLSGDHRRYPEEMVQEAHALREQGWGYKTIARELGVGVQTVKYWIRPELYEEHKKATQRSRKRRRDAEKALREKEQRRARDAAAKKVGGDLERAYSELRKSAQSLDRAIQAATYRSEAETLREARQRIYEAEERVAVALNSELKPSGKMKCAVCGQALALHKKGQWCR